MLTRVLIIQAAPTPWDAEGRMVGSHPLPLTAEGVDAIRHLLDQMPPDHVSSVYRPAANEACDQVARLIAAKFDLRVRDNPGLESVGLGLWQGLMPEDVKFRFPSLLKEWQENPLAVTPPDGEPLQEAIARIDDALKRILRRNRGLKVALPLRPMTMQIALGILRHETSEQIATHLQQQETMATIELDLQEYKAFIG